MGGAGLALALVRDMRELRAPSSAEEIEAFETDVLAGFVLARASAGLADSTIRNDAGHLDLIREWLAASVGDAAGGRRRLLRPGAAEREAVDAHRTGGGAGGFFQFLELRHKAEIYNLTGRVAECPLDEMNRPGPSRAAAAGPAVRGGGRAAVRGVAGGDDNLPEVRPGRPQLRGRPAAGRRRPADQRGPHAGPGRRALGPGPVRQAERPPRQGIPPQGSQAPAGAADQQRRPRTCAGSSRTCGASSATTTSGPVPRCSRPSARPGTAPPQGRPTTCSAGRWPRPPAATCPPGRGSSLRTSFGTSAPRSSASPG